MQETLLVKALDIRETYIVKTAENFYQKEALLRPKVIFGMMELLRSNQLV